MTERRQCGMFMPSLACGEEGSLRQCLRLAAPGDWYCRQHGGRTLTEEERAEWKHPERRREKDTCQTQFRWNSSERGGKQPDC